MVSYSQRVGRIPPYMFAEIDKAISEKRSKGVDVISLGVGDPDLPTPENIVEKLREAVLDPSTHKYPSYEGMLSFREAVAGWYKRRFNVGLDAKTEVLTLIGSKEGIGHTPLAFVNPGDIVLYSDPGYPVYRMATIFADGKPVAMPLLEEDDYKPDYGRISDSDLRKARLMFINYPNNPTAATADKEFLRETVDFAMENEIIVCHDAPYSEIAFDGYKAPSILEVPGAMECSMEFHSLSKTYNMTGWRIGFAVGNPDIVSGLGRIKQNVDSGAFDAVQIAGIEALNGPQDAFERNVSILRERRDVMAEGLKSLGWEFKLPKATFYLWVKVPGGGSSIEFAGRILDETGIVVTPGVGFGEYGEGYIRIALTRSKERIIEALERLENSSL
ncbi:MAG: LL-diaminopimelate aminotransferase [Candidatus Altiarchaeota archaeon]